jgi:hypothetical protein
MRDFRPGLASELAMLAARGATDPAAVRVIGPGGNVPADVELRGAALLALSR